VTPRDCRVSAPFHCGFDKLSASTCNVRVYTLSVGRRSGAPRSSLGLATVPLKRPMGAARDDPATEVCDISRNGSESCNRDMLRDVQVRARSVYISAHPTLILRSHRCSSLMWPTLILPLLALLPAASGAVNHGQRRHDTATLFGPRGSHTQFVAVSPGHAPPLAASFGHEAGLRGGLGSDGIAEDWRRLARLEGVEPG